MKKYNKPEIEALALETVDVIAVSEASQATLDVLGTKVASGADSVQGGNETLQINTEWSW